MIIHVFTANRYQLVPSISRGFVTTYKDDATHVLLLYGNKALDRQKYVELYEKEGFRDFVFCISLVEYMSVIWRYRKSSVLFHAGSYHWFLIAWLLGCKKMNWVCWGSGAASGKSFKSRLSLPYKRFLYSRFNSIVTLMDSDKESIIRDFHVSPSKIETLSYMSTEKKTQLDDLKEELMLQNKVNPKPIVLLGNNPSCMSSYMEILPRLKHYQGKIVVKCMLNYSLQKDGKYESLLNLGRSIFGNDFIPSEEFYEDKVEYIKYMNECDVYICPVRRQSGLGAINYCLSLGKKIYITGKNLEWIRSAYNAIVFDADEIQKTLPYEDFLKDLPEKDKWHNYNSRIPYKLTPDYNYYSAQRPL